MTNILLTAIGGDIAQGAATILRENFPGWRLIGTDIGERHAGSLYVDKVMRAVPATEPGYLPWLIDTLEAEKIDLCWPLSEPEIGVLAPVASAGSGRCTLITPGQLAVATGNDKYETSRFLKSLGLDVPWTVAEARDLTSSCFPCIYKPRRASGSRSIFTCLGQEDALFLERRFPGGVFQELLLPADREVTCAVYRTRKGQTHVLALLRSLTGGLTGWAQVIDDVEITQQCQRVAEALELHGSINIQLRLTDAGPRIFEINARLSSTVLMRHRMGFQDTLWTIKELLGQEIDIRMPLSGTIGVRTQNVVVIEEKKQ